MRLNVLLKTIGAFSLAGILLYFGFRYFLTDEQKLLLLNTPVKIHLLSVLFIIPTYFLGGLELSLLYQKIGKTKLSSYDILALPFAANLWGFLIPFQGSFFYTIAYIFSKYKRKISESTRVYLISFSATMSFAGLIGCLCFFLSDLHLTPLFLIICSLLLINPIVLYFFSKMLATKIINKSHNFNNTITKLSGVINTDSIDKNLIASLIGLKLLNVLATSLWSYWIAVNLNLDFTFIQLALLSLLMNITALIKITPGNIGFSQFASGGIALLVGGSLNDGFLLSSFQYLTIIIIAFSLGSLFTLLNMKHLNFSSIWSASVKMNNDLTNSI